MDRKHAAIIASILALCAVIGAVALLRTTHVGAKTGIATTSVSAQIAARERALTRQESALQKALAQPVSTLPTAGVAAPRQRVVYVRPAPRVITIHRSHGDDGSESSGSQNGGGFDD
jgi:hypothetical protein